MMNWIFGLPETVSAEISTMYSPKMPNDTADFLNGKRDSIFTVYEGRDDLKMVLAALLSAREGCRVRIDDKRIYEL
jgi:hypothetical protein